MKKYIVEKKFKYRGYTCIVALESIGYRTGRIGIPKGEKYYNKKHYLLRHIQCHGGLTDSSFVMCGHKMQHLWWVMFDTCHQGDGKDIQAIKEHFSDDQENLESIALLEQIYANQIYEPKTTEFCVEECKKVVDQLLGIANESKE